MDENEKKLQEEIESVLNTLENLSPDSEKYKNTVENLEKLYEMRNAAKKIELDAQDKEARREMEERHYVDEVDANYQAKREELEERRKQRNYQMLELLAGIGVTVLTFGGQIIFHNHWMKETFKFEKTDSFSSSASRAVSKSVFDILKFKPLKR